MDWEPTETEVEDKLIEMAYVWGDIEERIEQEAADADGGPLSNEQGVAWGVGRAFRVEAIYDQNGFGDPCSSYVLLYDVTDKNARKAVEHWNRREGWGAQE